MKRHLIILFCLAFNAVAATKPNLVFILADDLGWGEVGCYGQTKIRTPNIDRLAAQGTRFLRAYAGAPVCAPSRCVLLTGLQLSRAPIRGNKEHGEEGQFPLASGYTTWPSLLAQNGYATCGIGKWGLGMPDNEGNPLRHGFSHFFGYLCQRAAHSYYPAHLWSDNQKITLNNGPDGIPGRGRGNDFDRFQGTDYAPDRMMAEAKRWLDQRANDRQPFLLYLAFVEPHLALQPPQRLVDTYPKDWDPTPYLGQNGYVPHPRPRAAYAALITSMDEHVGQIMQWLDKHQMTDNTIVIFTSDNGATHNVGGVDTEFFNSTGGLRGLKGSLHEGGLRVPFIVRWPGHTPAGVTRDEIVAFPDILPTVCDLVGVPAPKCDGISLRPLLEGKPTATPHPPLTYDFPEYGGQQAVIDGKWKLIRKNLRKTDPNKPTPWELYDLGADRNETTDLAAQYPDEVKRLEAIFTAHWTPNPDFPMHPPKQAPPALTPSAPPSPPPSPSAESVAPTAKTPFTVPTDPVAKKELVKAIHTYMSLPVAEVRAHPSAPDFPGVAPTNAPRVSRVFTFSAKQSRWQSTGLYANAGEIVTVTPLANLPPGVTVEIRVGCHTDRLFGDTITQWRRFPSLSRVFPLLSGPTPVANAFGGPIFVVARGNADANFSLRFDNAVEAPFFVLGRTSVAAWQTIRQHPAPWAELVGHNMILHFPASQIRTMDDPTPLLEWWDKVVAAQDWLVGWPTRTTQERVVPDRQISAGWMHSGYPFMCHLASAPMITDLARLRANGDWGFFHELGHNHQSPAWTFPGQTEVTVNFFSLYCMEHIVGKPRGTGHPAINGPKFLKCLERRFGNPPSDDPFDQLAAFIVLLHKFGWEPLQRTLASYQTAPLPPKLTLAEKQAEFVRRYSRQAGANLTAYFKQMGYACPDELVKELAALPPFDYAAWRAQNQTITTATHEKIPS